MASQERPRLIALDVIPFQAEGQELLRIANRDRLSDQWLPIRREAGVLLQYMDGKHEIGQIREAVQNSFGVAVADDTIRQLVQLLDEVFVLDTPKYRDRKRVVDTAFRQAPIREAAHAGGTYAADPRELHRQIHGLFEGPKGPGTSGPCVAEKPLRAILAPHIDFRRGGPTFAWAFRELAEQTKATVFVLIGTSHYSASRFILTRKDFRTPLGIARTNRDYVDRLAAACDFDVFEDELAHKPEHSLEFHVLFLQYLFNHRRRFTIVPLLVGSFADAVEGGKPPNEFADIRQMATALREAEAESTEEVCYVVSGDLAHVGMKFGDSWKVDEARGRWCRKADEGLLGSMATGKSNEFFEFIRKEKDERRICGFPPGYTMLDAVEPSAANVLSYDQFLDPRGFEIVSFASMAFYR